MDLSSYSPALVLVVIVALALAPFVAVMVTSFTKIVVVLSLLRNALGLQQVPPNVVINGLAIVLSIYVMYPVILQTYEAVTAHQQGRPVPAEVQAQVDRREREQAARARAQAERAAQRAQAPGADGGASAAAPAGPLAQGAEPPPASPAAADALRAESEAETARAASEPGPLFRNVTTGETAEGGDGAQAEIVVPAPAQSSPPVAAGTDGARLLAMFEAGKEPLRTFLIEHSNDAERGFFLRSARSLLPESRRNDLSVDDFIVVVPAFTVSELTAAFQIGFLIFLPFLIIDLVVANILLALGMMMMSPTTVSLPFKLLLFVLIDGWAKLVHGLVLTYTPGG
ncbi:EscR/YscR/HrcR family type III secretion system export apparatus protein [Luteimonas sp. M1R5S18]|jgi:type III secretion protein R|uniref:EscR/YscR/HrcR family type III secretion system export apparatus protein n=1 Tax=Luteimonas rhizosphaericola TaxID=3042024 RepID=A0ABT6JIV1_9GAMM|nr:EscR/YscR/HrcR family type III secretion system export apparatus protein [Luteimonas rhizosphaericola]MDH5830564.1 EscR/YscR/HrcR family type III secretion system export apparatus protein [Luteimonas rhizosphaericola]